MEGIAASVALVTGAASGIGRATALAFARYGAKVGLIDIDADGIEETASQIAAQGGEAWGVVARVDVPEQMAAALTEIERTLGPIDHAFNGAGIRGAVADAATLTPEQWRAVIDVNLTGTFVSLQAELRVMEPRGRGHIVNAASVLGLVGGGMGSTQYSASKHAVIGLSKTAALESIGKGIRINTIAPGFVETAMVVNMTPGGRENAERMFSQAIPMGRLAQPSEIAEVIIWLCSDAAAYLVGHTVVIDAGLIAGVPRIGPAPQDEAGIDPAPIGAAMRS